MELHSEIEPEARPTALYHMTDSEIGNACREAEELLASCGIDRDETATVLGLSPITLKSYRRGVATVSHRRMPAVTLDRIRDIAMDAYWRAAAWPYRQEVRGDAAHLTPVYTAHDETGLVRDRHPHPLRMQEVADKLGGSVRVTWCADPRVTEVTPLDAMAALRSRWRRGAWQIGTAFNDLEVTERSLCEMADCDRYTLWNFSTEYRPWQRQVTTSQVERVEAAVADIAAGRKIQPWQSADARAMADLEDF